MKDNEQIIKDAITTSDFLNGGKLHPKQQAKFITYVLEYSQMLSAARNHRMTQGTEEIDKLHVSEPITESAEENTAQGSPNNQGQPKYNKISLVAKKIRSTWNISTETLQNNIEQFGFEETLMRVMTQRMATDLEMLAIQGDTTAGSTTKVARLLNRLDGWGKQTDDAHILDAGGLNVNKDIFRVMKRMMPQQYLQDPGLRWIMSPSIYDDWVDWLAEQKVADSFVTAVQGRGVNPLGIPIMQVPMIPDYLPVSYPGSAGPGTAIGAAYGPFDVIAGQNDAVKLTVVDSGGTHSITEFTLTPGTLHASEIANQINAQFVANSALAVAKDNGDGRLRLETTEGGAAYNIQVEATGTPSENFLLNTAIIATATYSGTAADGTVDEGSFIWLANPKNFVWGILQGTRIYTNFEEKTDTIENIVYNQVDAKVENIDAIVKCVNVRLTDLS